MTRKKQVSYLLQRFQFIDFSKIVAVERKNRKDSLISYLDRDRKGRWKSYKGFRALVPDIAGVKRGLDLTEALSREDIHKGLKLNCHVDDLGFNIEAADTLFDFIRPQKNDAYDDHPKNSLRIGPDRTIPMQVEHYVVADDRGIFRWVYPRREPLLGKVPNIAMSLIYHNYVRGDFSEFDVEMIDLSCDQYLGPRGGLKTTQKRNPRIIHLQKDALMSRQELNEQANHIYKLLMEIADE